MDEKFLKQIDEMLARRIGALEDSLGDKLDLLGEGQQMLSERMDRMETSLDKRIESLERQVDSVALDLAGLRPPGFVPHDFLRQGLT